MNRKGTIELLDGQGNAVRRPALKRADSEVLLVLDDGSRCIVGRTEAALFEPDSYPALSLEEIEREIAEIVELATGSPGDYEQAHAREDELVRLTLETIANDSASSYLEVVNLAVSAIKVYDVEFPRACS